MHRPLFHDFIALHARLRPDHPALAVPGCIGHSWDAVAQTVAGLRGQLAAAGVPRGGCVATLLPDSAEAALALLAITSHGVAAPLDPSLPQDELEERMTRVSATAVVVPAGSELAGFVRSTGIPVLELRGDSEERRVRIEGVPDGSGLMPPAPGDTALRLFTSGTGALPKLVPLTHANLLAAADAMSGVLALGPSDRCLRVMPLHHIHGLSTLFATVHSGGCYLCPSSRFEPDAFYEWLAELKPTWFSGSPAIHRMVYEHRARGRGDLRQTTLRFIRSASAPMPREWIGAMEATFGVPLIEAYGLTEAAPQVASNRLPPAVRKPGSVGPAAGPEIGILGPDGRLLGPGEAGEIGVRGANVTSGYEDAHTEPGTSFVEGWLRTGDVGHLDADGHLFVTGRLKELINRGGEKVSPHRVEAALLRHPAVAEAVVFDLPHPVLGEEVAAAVVMRREFREFAGEFALEDVFPDRCAEILREHCRRLLAPFEVPARILLVDTFPSNSAGKVARRRMAEVLRPQLESPAAKREAQPRGELESVVAGILAEVLGLVAVGRHDDFFALGGHSLSALQAALRIERALGLEVSALSLFDHPTAARLASHIATGLGERAARGRLPLRPRESAAQVGGDTGTFSSQFSDTAGEIHLTPQQAGVYLLEQLNPGSAYHMSASLGFRGSLDPDLLGRCLDELRARHEVLRSVFEMRAGGPVQRILPPSREPLPVVDLSHLPPSRRPWQGARAVRAALHEWFDLRHGPLLRCRLIQLSPETHVLVLSLHHLVCDAWSVGVLHRDLRELYAARLARREPALEDLPVSYSDYARSLATTPNAGAGNGSLAYWVRHLKGAPSLCTFPSARPRSHTPNPAGATVRSRIDPAVVRALTALGQRTQSTLFMVCLAAFKALLARQSGVTDCVVGTPIAIRGGLEFESAVGFFANTLALRTDLSGDPSLIEAVRRVHATVMPALEHPAVPIEAVVDALRLPRSLDRSPLFQVMFAFQNLPLLDRDDPRGRERAGVSEFAPGLLARPLRGTTRDPKFDLGVYLEPRGQGLEITWRYSTDRYDRAEVEHWADQYRLALVAFVSNGEARLSQLPGPERQADWLDCFARQVRRSPSATALTGAGPAFTYAGLESHTNRLAHALLARGIRRGDLVAICTARSTEMIAAVLAIWKAGAAYLPLDPATPVTRAGSILREARAGWAIGDRQTLPMLRSAADPPARTDHGASDVASPVLLELDLLREASSGMPDTPPRSDAVGGDLAYVIHTSGSTGRPKGVMVTRANVTYYAGGMAEALGIRATDVALHTASLAFSSSVRQFLVPLSCGATVVVAADDEVRDPEALCRCMSRNRASVLDLVPSFWAVFADALEGAGRGTTSPTCLRLLLSASERLPVRLAERLRQLAGAEARLLNLYGQTETTGIVAVHETSSADGAHGRLVVPVGQAIRGTRLRVVGGDGQPAPAGVWGELHVEGPGVGLGYLNQPELTARSFRVGEPGAGGCVRGYRTGDLARVLSDGAIEVAGRVDEQIKIRGHRVEPAEIESVLSRHPAVGECAVTAYAEGNGDGSETHLAAFVSARPGSRLLDHELRAFAREYLPHYMIPRGFVALERLPRTVTGKLDLGAMRAQLRSPRREPSPADDPHGETGSDHAPVRQRLLEIFSELLGRESVGPEENFFDLGGNSLLALQVVYQANRAGLKMTLADLFRFQTVSELALELGGRSTQPSAPAYVRSSGDDPMEGIVRVSVSSLRSYGREALTRAGLVAGGAEVVAEVQLEASLRGQHTHDMVSIPRYARRIAAGRINRDPRIRVEHETGGSASLDGDNGPGQWVAALAMDLAVAKARIHGVGVVTARRSNHFGAAGHYVWQAARQGFIGLCTTNGPAVLAPTGGVTPTFGNNPIGVGIPAGRHHPILLDMALSVAPRGRIGQRLAEGGHLPEGWILDAQGRPSRELSDLAAGLGVPIGGHKGYGLALVMEILAGVLGGAGFGAAHERSRMEDPGGIPDIGHFFLAIDPAVFIPPERFRERVDALILQTKGGRRIDGVDEILVPGEAELRHRERSLRDGVRLRPSTYRALLQHARSAGLSSVLEVVSSGNEDRE